MGLRALTRSPRGLEGDGYISQPSTDTTCVGLLLAAEHVVRERLDKIVVHEEALQAHAAGPANEN